jgi:hypothetical protein
MENQTQMDFNLKNEKKILEYLKNGKRLSVSSCARIIGTNELRHYVAALIRKGNKIANEWKKSESGKRYKEYFLPKNP